MNHGSNLASQTGYHAYGSHYHAIIPTATTPMAITSMPGHGYHTHETILMIITTMAITSMSGIIYTALHTLHPTLQWQTIESYSYA